LAGFPHGDPKVWGIYSITAPKYFSPAFGFPRDTFFYQTASFEPPSMMIDLVLDVNAHIITNGELEALGGTLGEKRRVLRCAFKEEKVSIFCR
jgi:hypothetical protein